MVPSPVSWTMGRRNAFSPVTSAEDAVASAAIRTEGRSPASQCPTDPPPPSLGMNSDEFRVHGKAMVDFIANYLDGVRDRPVLPSVEPGYLQHMIPTEAPEHPETWEAVMKDVERVVMPGLTHWQSPRFHAYYPAGSSYPSILGELLSSGLGVLGFHWLTNPAGTELEVVIMDWMAKLLGLPEHFLSTAEGPGGGLIQSSASEAILVCLLAAQEKTLRKVRLQNPDWEDSYIRGKMVAYSSDHSNSSVEKAGRLASMRMRLLETDQQCRLRGATLLKAIQEDIAEGLIPTYVCAAMGTTATCAFDCLAELGPICRTRGVWLHVDAAYGGAALVCPEYRPLLHGIHYADSFVFNPHKWLLINFDCSALWVRDSHRITDVFGVDRIYLKHQQEGNLSAPDFRNWEIPLGRRFRALKVWFTLRMYGVSGLQEYIRKQVRLAKQFETMVKEDSRFEIVAEVSMALVCFRMKGENHLTKRLLGRLTARKNIYVIAGEVRGAVFIRFAVSSRLCEAQDVVFAWSEIRDQAQVVLAQDHDDDLAVSDAVAQRSIEEELFIKTQENGKINMNEAKGKIFVDTNLLGKRSESDLLSNLDKLQISLNGVSVKR